MRVLPTAQYAFRQAATELPSTVFPSAIRTLASIIASVTIIITIYLGYRKCIRGRDDSFSVRRNHQEPFGIPLTSYDAPGSAYSDEYLPVYVGNGRYIYVSRNELPRDPPNVMRRDSRAPTHFDAGTLTKFEAANDEKHQSCAICLEQLQEEPVSAGQCLHLMHNNCLTSWLNKDASSNCPVCRVRIEESASFDELQGKVFEISSLALPARTRDSLEGSNLETGIGAQAGAFLTDNVASLRAEADSASHRIPNDPTEIENENNMERESPQLENSGRPLEGEVHDQTAETDSASHQIPNDPMENDSEIHTEWESPQLEDSGRPLEGEIHDQSGLDTSGASSLPMQEIGGRPMGNRSREMSSIDNDREVAVANK
ncbi:unnamed protein product [Agarophyton chilense]|eukprot:gb/GEZJ01004505.1/.p1 GENE.gb/GEZJ01004505.1/~~gb/GEZJ01004505.1/.p1  ORF type:complete len:372 (-),score=36.36 gb/GEZJ01004505.1/:532-1647(-)